MDTSILHSILPAVVAIVIGIGLQLGYHVTYVRLSNAKSVQDTLNQYNVRLSEVEKTNSVCNKVAELEESIKYLDGEIHDLRDEIEKKCATESWKEGTKPDLEKDALKTDSVKIKRNVEQRKAQLLYVGFVAMVALQLVLSICVIVTCILVRQQRSHHSIDKTKETKTQKEVKSGINGRQEKDGGEEMSMSTGITDAFKADMEDNLMNSCKLNGEMSG